MTAGGRSNSSGAGVSSLVSGGTVNDTVSRVNHSTHSSAGAHHSDGAANAGDANNVGSSVGEGDYD